MMPTTKHASLSGNLMLLGFGSIGQAMLPLLFRHIEINPGQVKVIAADEDGKEIASALGVNFTVQTLTEGNYQTVLESCLSKGDFLLNLSVDVSSLALIQFCAASSTWTRVSNLGLGVTRIHPPRSRSARITLYARKF